MARISFRDRRAALVAAVVLALGCGRSPLRVEPIASSPAVSSPEAADPALAVDPPTGDLLLTWVGGEHKAGWRLYFARSVDAGRTWSDPVAITGDTGLVHPHGEAAPRLVAAPGHRIAVVWTQGFAVAGREWPATQLRAARSVDGGRTWSTPATLNDDTVAAPVSHTFQGAAWTGDSGLTVAWLDERRGGPVSDDHANHDSTASEDATIYSVSSPDFGASWEPNRPLWGAACPCCRVALARSPDGAALAASWWSAGSMTGRRGPHEFIGTTGPMPDALTAARPWRWMAPAGVGSSGTREDRVVRASISREGTARPASSPRR
jgi:hypothetical protein